MNVRNMNILFALYNGLECNSGGHVRAIAQALADMGASCIVAVPDDHFRPVADVGFLVMEFGQVLQNPSCFPDGRPADVLHAWTPRESVRKFWQELRGASVCKTVVHLEDNEEHLARVQLGDRRFALEKLTVDGTEQGDFPLGVSHPRRYRQFMEDADGATVLIDALRDFVPAEKPCQLIWPAADPDLWRPRPRNDAYRRSIGIGDECIVLGYHGNVHFANQKEVTSLYLAAALLCRSGLPTKVLRVGQDYANWSQDFSDWAAEFVIHLGWQEQRSDIVEAMSAADIFVQPGIADDFNNYRFPSKLPEFFSLGRPVVLPRTNIGLKTEHLVDAYVLEQANGPGICEAVKHIVQDEALYRKLSDGSVAFAERHFDWAATAACLMDFYTSLASGSVAASQPGADPR